MAGRRRGLTPSVPECRPVRIERIGAEGDGIGRFSDGTPVYVPFTLPGELVRAGPGRRRGEGWAARPEALIEPSPERVEPACPYFGICGGCKLQHWGDEPYRNWKSGLLKAALERAGFQDVAIEPLRISGPRSRRRADFALRRCGGRMVVGFHRAGAADVVDLGECLVLAPKLQALIALLREALAAVTGLRREGSAVVNLFAAGPDVLLRTDSELTLTDRLHLTAFARRAGVARLSWAKGHSSPEPICEMRTVAARFGPSAVALPPGAFLQATEAGEAAIAAAVCAGLPGSLSGSSRIAELYAGCGTLTLPLAQHGRVMAWEGDEASVAALAAGVRRSGLAGRIEFGRRDLARQPLSASELRGFAAIVLDPPFAGAGRQIGAVAASGAARVVYVSCNPAMLVRDARVLRQTGYRVLQATPIDQFLWSARLEAVVVFARD